MSKKTKKRSQDNKKEPAKKNKKKGIFLKRNTWLIVTIIIIAASAIFYITGKYKTGKSDFTQRAGKPPEISTSDIESLKGGETRPTLLPSYFTGKTAEAYKVAMENRELIDSIYCYCNCKKNLGHKSLLSCYADNHSENCDICQDQALHAYSLQKSDMNILEIRKEVDKQFWRPLR